MVKLPYKSKLKCPKCGYIFEYKWIPMVSISKSDDKWDLLCPRLINRRYIKCPHCGKRSWFNMAENKKRK